MVDMPDGKKKMMLDKYIYDLGSCTFCNLCVTSCPTDAIRFSNDFEQAVFNRDVLVKQLNYLPEKIKPTPAKPAAPVAKPAEKVEPKADAPEAKPAEKVVEKPVEEAAKPAVEAEPEQEKQEKQ